jgi:predicted acylesterase/phospholipase RssA
MFRFVCATQAENSSTVVIRSYETYHHDSLADFVKIWEAARATSAASTFFNPITIGPYGQTFVDGALKHNNPINLVDLESSEIWPEQDRIIISIGSGSAPGEDLLGNLKDLAKKLAKIVTDTEEENELFRRKHQAMVDSQRLYRFNVLQGLADVGLEEHEAKARIVAHTGHYLGRSDTQRDIMACSSTLVEGAQRLGYVGGEG